MEPIHKEDKEAQEVNKLKFEDSFTQYMEEACRYKETVIMELIKTVKDSWRRYSKINTPDKLLSILRIMLIIWITHMGKLVFKAEVETAIMAEVIS